MPKPVAVVTGASSGIGEATVRRLAQDGWDAVAVARRSERLDKLADETGCRPFALDVADEAAVSAFVGKLANCHLLVSNAGGALGLDKVAEAKDADWRWMYEVNVLGTMHMVRGLTPALVASGSGHIVVVTSITGHEVYPGGGGYAAAKHAQVAVVQTLRLELLGQPVRITEIAPGMVRSEYGLVRFRGDAKAAERTYEGVTPLTPTDVADAIAWTVSRPANVNVDLVMLKPLAQASNLVIHRASG